MGYLDIIALDRAKTYLRIDDGMNEDDAEIESMIKAAFIFMQRYTNYIFIPTDIAVTAYNSCDEWTKVYQYPINSMTPADAKNKVKPLYSLFYIDQSVDLYLNVGYTDTADVPDDFIQCALQLIKVWYYESEKQANSTLIPISVTQVLDTYRRFV